VHQVGFLFIVVIADARNHEPETHNLHLARTSALAKPRNHDRQTILHNFSQISNLMHKILYLFTYNKLIKILYMFRAVHCLSSGGLIVSMVHLISSFFKQVSCQQSDDTRCCIDTIRLPEDELHTARNM
jgi:hypothetical protein